MPETFLDFVSRPNVTSAHRRDKGHRHRPRGRPARPPHRRHRARDAAQRAAQRPRRRGGPPGRVLRATSTATWPTRTSWCARCSSASPATGRRPWRPPWRRSRPRPAHRRGRLRTVEGIRGRVVVRRAGPAPPRPRWPASAAGPRAFVALTEPLVAPFIEHLDAQGLLRPGITVTDATEWLCVVTTGLLATESTGERRRPGRLPAPLRRRPPAAPPLTAGSLTAPRGAASAGT